MIKIRGTFIGGKNIVFLHDYKSEKVSRVIAIQIGRGKMFSVAKQWPRGQVATIEAEALCLG